jgi:hypothetical protein
LGAQLEVVLVDHLSSEELSAYLSNVAGETERENVERHLLSCAECRAELIDGQRALATVPSSKRVNRTWYGVAGLAAAAAILVSVWPSREVDRALQPVERNTPPASAAGAITIVSPVPGSQMDASSRTFTWRRDDGSSYKVTVTDETGRSIWSLTTQDTTVVLPSSVELAPGSRYFWYVDALRPDARSVTSGINSFSTAR